MAGNEGKLLLMKKVALTCVVMVLFCEMGGSWGKILKFGQFCDPVKEKSDAPRYVGCGKLRLLSCVQPEGQKSATCNCIFDTLTWDPKAIRQEPDEELKVTPRGKRILKQDNITELGSCRVRHGESCELDSECFTGLKCLATEEGSVCTHPMLLEKLVDKARSTVLKIMNDKP